MRAFCISHTKPDSWRRLRTWFGLGLAMLLSGCADDPASSQSEGTSPDITKADSPAPSAVAQASPSIDPELTEARLALAALRDQVAHLGRENEALREQAKDLARMRAELARAKEAGLATAGALHNWQTERDALQAELRELRQHERVLGHDADELRADNASLVEQVGRLTATASTQYQAATELRNALQRAQVVLEAEQEAKAQYLAETQRQASALADQGADLENQTALNADLRSALVDARAESDDNEDATSRRVERPRETQVELSALAEQNLDITRRFEVERDAREASEAQRHALDEQLTLARQEHAALSAETMALREQLAAREESATAHAQTMATLEQRNQELSKTLAGTRESLNAALAQNFEAEEKRAALEALAAAGREREAQLGRAKDDLAKKLGEEEAQGGNVTEHTERSETALASPGQATAQLESQVQALRSQLEVAQERIEALSQAKAELLDKVAQADTGMEEQRTQSTQADQRLHESESELEQARAQIAALEAREGELIGSLTAATESVQRYQETEDTLNEELASLQQQLTRTFEELDTAKANAEAAALRATQFEKKYVTQVRQLEELQAVYGAELARLSQEQQAQQEQQAANEPAETEGTNQNQDPAELRARMDEQTVTLNSLRNDYSKLQRELKNRVAELESSRDRVQGLEEQQRKDAQVLVEAEDALNIERNAKEALLEEVQKLTTERNDLREALSRAQ